MNPTNSGQLGRRALIKGTAATAAAVAATTAITTGAASAATSAYFQHGVASGDPLPGAVVLWTRVTPTATSLPGSGVGPSITVTWQVARDAAFTTIVASGNQSTSPARDHTVKVDATGLAAATTYYFRFSYSGVRSPVGRTRTAPAAGSSVENLRLGVVSCANLQAGWFSAYRHLAAREDLHAILHLGDYLYEYGPGQYGYGKDEVDIRPHSPAREMVTLADYRQRHAQYKQDADLATLHAKYAFITTWDDHEVTNDAWRDGAENHTPLVEGSWATRRASAQKAYDEWMPIRLSGTAALGDGTQIYRRLAFGQLAELSMLDLRTYRDRQVTGLLGVTSDPTGLLATGEVSDPARTITGRAQLDWLKGSLETGRAQWKLVGNPVMIAPVDLGALPNDLTDPVADITGILPRDGMPYNTDQWDGYTDDRRELISHIRDQGVRDTLFLTGDIHSGWAADVPHDPALYPVTGDSAAVEFVCTSVTSNNLKDITGAPSRSASIVVEEAIKANNLHIKYLNFDDHGFSVLDLTPARAQMDWFVIGDRADKATGIAWTASYETRAGENKVRPVAKPVNA
ncbi:alkaline phosphatase D family protein [Nocardioides cavernaquae]|uniref:alkaline phosphatase D family protein n=1 Tax=Nocardioides cavernaquae TaxID=2321396 RepID=UPI0016004030|nr:alkaline phosphatase D family protein [Nocardioides cavernaquae]